MNDNSIEPQLGAGALTGRVRPMSQPSAAGRRGKSPTLRALAVGGSFWALLGFGGSNALRLLSSMIVTRLLLPEHLGLMAYVLVVVHGLQMFSDMGIAVSVVRDRRGGEPDFLNTAWTMQVIRGVALWLGACALAWPTAWFYDQPQLQWLIPVAGLASVFGGLESTSSLRLRRAVQIKPLVARDLLSQLAGMICIIAVAMQWKSVWALVFGTLVSAAARMVLTYTLLPGPRPRLWWDSQIAGQIVRFGRWLFLSTVVAFLVQQGDKMVLGKMVSASELGVYAVAALLARFVFNALQSINGQVLLPIYARTANTAPDRLRRQVFRSRIVLMGAFLPVAWCLSIFGQQVIDLIYDPRYAAGGWMLQVLSVGAIGAVVSGTIGSVLLSVGDSPRFMAVQATRGALLIGGMAIGGGLGGVQGLLIGIAASKFLDYPVLAWAVRRHGVWLPWLDAAALGMSAVVVGAGWWLD